MESQLRTPLELDGKSRNKRMKVEVLWQLCSEDFLLYASITKGSDRMKKGKRAAIKAKKGFTLVELIVVLVILAILAALLVPALTGYIYRAREKSTIAEARQLQEAAQTVVDEEYAKTASFNGIIIGNGFENNGQKSGELTAEALKLAEMSEGSSKPKQWQFSFDKNAKITFGRYQKPGYGNNAIKVMYSPKDGWKKAE